MGGQAIFIQLDRFSLFNNYYMYADRVPDYIVDHVLNDHEMKAHFLKEYDNKRYPGYRLVTCRIRKKYAEEFEKEVMPEAHKKLLVFNDKSYKGLLEVLKAMQNKQNEEGGK